MLAKRENTEGLTSRENSLGKHGKQRRDDRDGVHKFQFNMNFHAQAKLY